jgi:hypothetical protein
VSSKIDIVPHQDTVPTPLHSYTSGIGLSFLALPHHIHRITGNIPAPPFELDEPVDLIIAIDGSVLFGVGCHGWILATKDDTILLHGGGPDDGLQ